MDEREYNNVYAIPANYTDSGKLLGGMIDTRNAIETVILVLALGYPELILIPMPGTIRIVVMTVTLLPLAVVSAMGVDGGVAVSVHRPYHPFLDTPQEITLQEDRIPLWPKQKEKETAEKKSLSLCRIICPSAT